MPIDVLNPSSSDPNCPGDTLFVLFWTNRYGKPKFVNNLFKNTKF